MVVVLGIVLYGAMEHIYSSRFHEVSGSERVKDQFGVFDGLNLPGKMFQCQLGGAQSRLFLRYAAPKPVESNLCGLCFGCLLYGNGRKILAGGILKRYGAERTVRTLVNRKRL
jgi:hypothetical protein